MKATSVAHPIQGLIKYHGLKDPKQRIPFHDSISVCTEAFTTTTTVETDESLTEDLIEINGKKPAGTDFERMEIVLNPLRKMADFTGHFRVASKNSITSGKGLGFSASAFAALGKAACSALGLKIDTVSLSELVRLGAGSSTRSLAGGFAIWYANKEGRSYAERIPAVEAEANLSMVIIPIPSAAKTDEAHLEVLSSPLFKARLKHVDEMIEQMKEAVKTGNIAMVGRLAEEDTLNLHASTMTGKTRMVLWEPETLQIIKMVQKMRSEGVSSAWYSMDTGPSVFVNTLTDQVEEVARRIRNLGSSPIFVSKVGGEPFLVSDHLF
jgi:phosphomevalonate decarboxylase